MSKFKKGQLVYYRNWKGEIHFGRVYKLWRPTKKRGRAYSVVLDEGIFHDDELYATREEAQEAQNG